MDKGGFQSERLAQGVEYGRYAVSKVLDTAYQGFLGVGTTFDIFQNILFPYSLNTAYWSFLDTAYWILFPSWSLTLFNVTCIEPQFKNIIENGPYIPMIAGQRKPEGQWTGDERKAANLDQRLKSLILFVLPDDQMNFVKNYLTAKSTKDDLIIYHEGPYDVKESRVMDLKLCYNTYKLKKDFQDSPDDEEDTRDNQEYLNYLKEEFQERALLAKSKRFFKRGLKGLMKQRKLMKQNATNVVGMKPELRPTKDFEAKYKKVKAKLALPSSSTSAPKSSMVKNKGLVAEVYEWDKEEVLADDNEMGEVKVLMALVDDESVDVGKESAKNGERVKILMKKYDSADESSVCITSFPPLEKLSGAKPVSGLKTIKSILKSNSTFKAETLKGVTINEPSSALAKGNKNASSFKTNLAPAGKLKNVKSVEVITMIHMVIIGTVHTTIDHNDIKWFMRDKALLAKKVKVFQAKKVESSNATISKTPTKRTLIEPPRTMLLGSVFSKQYWTEAVAITCYTQSRCLVFIHNHKVHLGKFDVKADDVDDINSDESERYLPDEYLYPYEPSQRYQVDSNDVHYIEPYERPEPIVTEADTSLDHDQADQTDQLDQNYHPVQADEILNDDQVEHSNHKNDNHIIDNLPNTEDVQITEHLSSPTKDTSAPNIVSSIQTESPSSIPSMASPTPQDRWS
ncbi:hypothetical protein Tco_1492721 [Tanacetum coccineum]